MKKNKNLKYYKEILIKANPKLHETIIQEIEKKIPQNSKILDLGAGEGAMSQRLIDNGYNVTAFDLNKEKFKAVGADFHSVDFNNNIEIEFLISKYKNFFDAIISLEVIEHVENPWEYIRLIKKMVKKDGVIFITTPNCESWLSRFNFLFFGKFLHFSDEDYINSGHINPITKWEIINILKKEDISSIENKTICNFPFFITKNIKIYLFYFLYIFLFIFMKGNFKRDILLIIGKK